MKLLAVLTLLILCWIAGLAAFAARVERSTPALDPAAADGIVALTGASDARIKAAVALLEAGKGGRMLISGVNPEVTRADIRGVAKATRRLYDCCVDLGFRAVDTVGNARETADWVRVHDYHSVIVVTSDFHMPRAMLELHAALPETRFASYPVSSPELNARRWWRTREGARRMIIEYCKYLAILARQSALGLIPKSPAGSASPAGASA